MAQIVAMHSYRGGTGKSSAAANMAFLATREGLRVGLVDTDLQAPDAHVLLGMRDVSARCSLTDYLVGRCEIEDAASPVTYRDGTGELYLVPARGRVGDINEIMNRGYDVGLLPEGFKRLIDKFSLDVLFLDTHAGVGNETVVSVASADSVIIVTRSDHLIVEAEQTTSIASRLAHGRHLVVVNMLPDCLSSDVVIRQAEEIYSSPVAAVLPYYPDMAALGSQCLFARDYPDHQIVMHYRKAAASILLNR